jgi:intracellular septation protein
MDEPPRSLRLLGWAADGAPWVLFLLVYAFTRDFRLSTLVLVIAAALSMVAGLAIHRRPRALPMFLTALAVLFGGASLLFKNPEILKMKMSIVDGLLGAAIFLGLAMKKNPLKVLLGGAVALSDRAWQVLAVRYALFWWACAVANEIVRRTQSEHVWVLFRGVALAAGVVFAFVQVPFMLKHGAGTVKEPPPDPGL